MNDSKQTDLINMNDIAHILILYNYIQYSNGQLRYKNETIRHSNEHEYLLSYIRHVHIDEIHQQIDIEFLHDPNHFLQLPSNWYQEISRQNFNRSYIVDRLLNNGGIIKDDHLSFNHHSYALKFSSKEKENLIDSYVEFINNQGGIKYDNTTNLLLLENPSDGSELYLTKEHTKFIQQNQYRRQDMKYLLNKYSELKQDEFGNWLLYYNDQCVPINPVHEQVHIAHSKSDPNLKLLFPFNKSLRLIQKSSSTTTLDIQQPNEENDYAMDPILILANYIYRAGTIYQDEFGRLVIKLHRDEIVVPRQQAFNSILEINTSPNRTGTIIARLISRLGKVQSTKSGGLMITIGKGSLELSKEIIDQSKINLNLSNENLASSILPSKSSDSLASSRLTDNTKKSRSQTSLSIKPRLLIIRDNEITRFYLQYTYEEDRRSNSVMTLPSRYPVRPTQPRLIAPEHYRDITLRDASVHVRQEGENEVYYENLAQYLSTNQTDISSRIVRRMLKFTTRDEYFAYLHNQMSAINAEQLVQESEESFNEIPTRFTNIRVQTPDREINDMEDNHRRSPLGAFYNVSNGRTSNESFLYEEQEQYNHDFIERSASSSSLSSDMLITKTYPSNRTIPISQYN
jgi:hypothetical protein